MNRRLPDDLRVQLNAERTALRELGETDDVAPAYLRLCGELARFHAHARAMIRESGTVDAEAAMLRRLLDELDALARASAASGGQVARLAEASASDDAVLPKLFAAVARDGGSTAALDALSAQLGMEPAVLGYVGRLLAAPFLAEERFRHGALPEHDAREAEPAVAVRCPRCRAEPLLAMLGPADNCRRLVCSLCGESWIAPRVLCAFCGSRRGLGTLRATADDARWVETCDACGRFLKTVDLQRMPEHYVVWPIVEQAASAHLEVIAAEAGYGSLPGMETATTQVH